MKTIFVVIFLGCAAFAQNDAAIAQAKSACGPDKVHFDVEAINFTESITQPPDGKAFVYVIAQDEITSRIGLDGAWVGAVEGASHMSFSVDPGEHHLCASWQSAFLKGNRVVGLSSFIAEAGKVYFFRIRATQRETALSLLDLEPMNSDKGFIRC